MINQTFIEVTDKMLESTNWHEIVDNSEQGDGLKIHDFEGSIGNSSDNSILITAY